MYTPYKILMLTTSMGYGGAETHIIELSKYLRSNGCEVKIVSNSSPGDLFEKECANSGIEHIYAPFHSRNIFSMRKSGKIIKKIIGLYKPDIVHAHARIPAFVASGVCRKVKIPLVTTIHGTYKNSFLLKLATNWGDYSLYVSDDIKDYWTKYYKLKPGYMTKTVNAVNTDLFRENIKNIKTETGIRGEFNITPGEKIILTVSRLDAESSYSAAKLCEIAGDIYSRDKNTRIIIVGGGEIFDEIKSKADGVNKTLGFDYIIMTGGRTDVYKFCAECAVFAGISRSALEALACAKPVVLCGDYGWLGRFTRGNSEKCESTNFTCRGFEYPENAGGSLLNELMFCLDEKNKSALEPDCRFGADLIREKYGVKKMADDAYSVYRKAVLKYRPAYDFVLSGYYGYGNIGDDALLFTVVSNILREKQDLKICLLTRNAKKFQEWLDGYFCNIIAKPRFNFISVRRAIKKSKALVFGGGTLLQDSTSTRSFLYYMSLIKSAAKYNKKIILYANGIGPIYNPKNGEKIKAILPCITLATIRDEDSYNQLIEMGADKDKTYLTSDEVMTVNRGGYLNAYKKDFKEYIKGGYIAICVRKWKSVGADFFGEFSAAIDVICRENNLIPVYVVMQPKNDKSVSEQLSTLNSRGYLADVGGDIEKALAIIRSADAVISMRLHLLVFAAVFGIPMIGISYDPKVRSFLNDVFESDDYTLELSNFSKDALVQKFKILTSNRGEANKKIVEKADKLREKAESNAGLFLNAMGFEKGADEI